MALAGSASVTHPGSAVPLRWVHPLKVAPSNSSTHSPAAGIVTSGAGTEGEGAAAGAEGGGLISKS